MTDTIETLISSAASAKEPAKTSIFSNLEALRLSTDTVSTTSLEVMTRVPVRKPTRQEYVRVHPGKDMSLPTQMVEEKDSKEIYLVAPNMYEHLLGDMTPVLLTTTISRQGAVTIWPIKLPGDTDMVSGWQDSSRQAAELAKSKWVRIASDMALGAYRVHVAQGELPDPKWPDKPFGELLEVAFRGKVIDNENHPVIQRLRGRI